MVSFTCHCSRSHTHSILFFCSHSWCFSYSHTTWSFHRFSTAFHHPLLEHTSVLISGKNTVQWQIWKQSRPQCRNFTAAYLWNCVTAVLWLFPLCRWWTVAKHEHLKEDSLPQNMPPTSSLSKGTPQARFSLSAIDCFTCFTLSLLILTWWRQSGYGRAKRVNYSMSDIQRNPRTMSCVHIVSNPVPPHAMHAHIWGLLWLHFFARHS